MHKFMVKLSAIVILSGLSASVALAHDHNIKITTNCPKIDVKGENKVTHYGTTIAGHGFERVNSDAATQPLFQGTIVPGTNIPTDLLTNGYTNSEVFYNPVTGAVICSYESSMGFAPFSISYVMSNAFNGTTVGAGVEQIHLKIPVG